MSKPAVLAQTDLRSERWIHAQCSVTSMPIARECAKDAGTMVAPEFHHPGRTSARDMGC
jgi:hypothetical protein